MQVKVEVERLARIQRIYIKADSENTVELFSLLPSEVKAESQQAGYYVIELPARWTMKKSMKKKVNHCMACLQHADTTTSKAYYVAMLDLLWRHAEAISGLTVTRDI
jgi:hypothetical protein